MIFILKFIILNLIKNGLNVDIAKNKRK